MRSSQVVPVASEEEKREEVKSNTQCMIVDKMAALEFKEDIELEQKAKEKEDKIMELTRKLGATRLEPQYRIPPIVMASFCMKITLKQGCKLSKVYRYEIFQTESNYKWIEKYPVNDFSLLPIDTTTVANSTLSVNDVTTTSPIHSAAAVGGDIYSISFNPPSNGLFNFYIKSSRRMPRKLGIKEIEKVFCEDSVFVPFSIDLPQLYPTRNVTTLTDCKCYGMIVCEERGLILMARYNGRPSIVALDNEGDFYLLYKYVHCPIGIAFTFDESLIVIGYMGIYKLSFIEEKEDIVIEEDYDGEAFKDSPFENEREGMKLIKYLEYPKNDFSAIAVSPVDGCVYIVQNKKCCINVFSSDLIPLRSFGTRGDTVIGKLGDFQSPYCIAIDTTGILYISDRCAEGYAAGTSGNSGEVYMYNSNGQYVGHIHCDKFIPHAITVGPDGLIYVAGNKGHLYVFTNFGQLVRMIETESPVYAISYDKGTLAYTTSNGVMVYDGQLPVGDN